jgi:hypothetical protein
MNGKKEQTIQSGETLKSTKKLSPGDIYLAASLLKTPMKGYVTQSQNDLTNQSLQKLSMSIYGMVGSVLLVLFSVILGLTAAFLLVALASM